MQIVKIAVAAGLLALVGCGGSGGGGGTTSNATGPVIPVVVNPPIVEASFAARVDLASARAPSAIALADINGDLAPEIIGTVDIFGDLAVYRNATTFANPTSFAPAEHFGPSDAPRSVSIADMNGDGRADVIVGNHSAPSPSFVGDPAAVVFMNVSMSGALAFDVGGPVTATSGPSNEFAVLAADVTGDGRADLIVEDESELAIFENVTVTGSAQAAFGPRAALVTQARALGDRGLHIDDLNGDGRADIVVGVGANTQILVGSPGGAVAGNFDAPLTITGTGRRGLVIADLDGDGVRDVLSLPAAASPTAPVPLHATLNQGQFGGPVALAGAPLTFDAQGAQLDGLIAADLNGDLRPEIIARAGSTIAIFSNLGGGQLTAPIFVQSPGLNALAVADVQGDGKPDLIGAASAGAGGGICVFIQR